MITTPTPDELNSVPVRLARRRDKRSVTPAGHIFGTLHQYEQDNSQGGGLPFDLGHVGVLGQSRWLLLYMVATFGPSTAIQQVNDPSIP